MDGQDVPLPPKVLPLPFLMTILATCIACSYSSMSQFRMACQCGVTACFALIWYLSALARDIVEMTFSSRECGLVNNVCLFHYLPCLQAPSGHLQAFCGRRLMHYGVTTTCEHYAVTTPVLRLLVPPPRVPRPPVTHSKARDALQNPRRPPDPQTPSRASWMPSRTPDALQNPQTPQTPSSAPDDL